MRTHRKIRIFLFMLAFGLAAVQFFPFLYEKWTEVYVDLPKVESDSPILVFPKQVLTEEVLRKQKLLEQKRDLSFYDKAKTFSNFCLEPLTEKDCNKLRVKARQFIFNHLKEKKRGYIVYEFSGVDSGVNNHIYIEPDENGKWRIILIKNYFGIGYGMDETDKDNFEPFEVSSVKYKRATKDDFNFEIGIYYLLLLDENGKEVFGL